MNGYLKEPKALSSRLLSNRLLTSEGYGARSRRREEADFWTYGGFIRLLTSAATLDYLRYQPGPSSLMRCAHATARIAMKVFMKQNVILEMRVTGLFRMAFQNRALP